MAKAQTVTGGREATVSVIPGRWALSVGNPGTEPPPGFRWLPLTSLARLESGHTPSRRVPSYWNGDIPWIGIRDATGNHGRVIYSTNESVTEEGIENSSARILPAGTVCLSRTASVGYVVSMGRPMATSQDFVNWVCGERLRSRYLHYILISEQESIRRFAVGSVHPTVYYPEAKAFQVCVPGIAQQDAILDILCALDDKIVVNDQLAQTSFDIADARFAQLGIHATHAESVGDLIELKYGKALPAADRIDGEFPVYGSGGVTGTNDMPLVEGPGVVVGRKGTVGAVYWSGKSFFPIDTTFYVELQRNYLSMEFAFYMLKHLGLEGMNSDSAVPGLNRSNVLALQVKVPGETELRRFNEEVRPLFALRESLSGQSASLAKLRDTLLPRLMSGEIRVRDAEKVVEDVT